MGLNLIDIATWWLILEVIGLVALPLASYAGRSLKDGGYSISKPLGLLLLTYISWILPFAGISYSSSSIWPYLGVVAVLSLAVYWKKGLPAFEKCYVIKFEVLFFLAFLIFSFIRAYSPNIYWTMGEKLMDMSYINSLLRTGQFPPLDPWMSGTVMHYYYLGYLVVADLIKLTGTQPSIAFNLATPSFFALSVTSAFGLGYNLTGRAGGGLVTAFFVGVAGNLAGFFQTMDLIQQGDVVNRMLSFNYWPSSRIIPNTINEFPFFSFLHADVHANMISFAFQLLIILLLLNVLKSRTLDGASIFLLGLSVGFLYPLNTWDYPTYLFLAISVMVIHFFLRKFSNASKKDAAYFIAAAGAAAALSYLLYLPYHLSYKVERAIAFVPSGRTSLVLYLVIYGLFIYMLYSYALVKYRQYNVKPVYFVVSLILLSVLSVALNFELLILLVSLLILSAILILKEKDENHVFVLVLVMTGALISLFCELFYIQDAMGRSNFAYIRMNTIFKLYLQNWILWGVATGAIVFQFRERLDYKRIWAAATLIFTILMAAAYPVFAALEKSKDLSFESVFIGETGKWILWVALAGTIMLIFRKHFTDPKKLWGAVALILILMVSIYPVFATIGKSESFRVEPTLSGEMYVKKEHPQEYEAIVWLRNLSGQPVVLQAAGDTYSWSTYVTAFTGLPTVMGWGGHEVNWRSDSSDVNTRWQNVYTMYTSSNLDEVSALLKKYNVSYIYFGDAEQRKKYTPKLFDSHPERFEKAFEFGDIVIYKIKPLS